MNFLKIILISIFIFTISKNTFSKEGDTHIGVDIGWGFIDIGAEQTAQTIANISGSTVLAEYDKAAFTGRVYFDYDIGNNILFEAGYFQSSNLTAKYTLSGASASESYSVNGFDLAAVYSEGNGLFFKGGFHSSTISGSANIKISGTTYAANASSSGGGFVYGIGYDFNDSTRVGYTYYQNVGGDKDADVGLLYYGFRF